MLLRNFFKFDLSNRNFEIGRFNFITMDFISDSFPLNENLAFSECPLDIAIELDMAIQRMYEDETRLHQEKLSLYSKFSHPFHYFIKPFNLFCIFHFR